MNRGRGLETAERGVPLVNAVWKIISRKYARTYIDNVIELNARHTHIYVTDI